MLVVACSHGKPREIVRQRRTKDDSRSIHPNNNDCTQRYNIHNIIETLARR